MASWAPPAGRWRRRKACLWELSSRVSWSEVPSPGTRASRWSRPAMAGRRRPGGGRRGRRGRRPAPCLAPLVGVGEHDLAAAEEQDPVGGSSWRNTTRSRSSRQLAAGREASSSSLASWAARGACSMGSGSSSPSPGGKGASRTHRAGGRRGGPRGRGGAGRRRRGPRRRGGAGSRGRRGGGRAARGRRRGGRLRCEGVGAWAPGLEVGVGEAVEALGGLLEGRVGGLVVLPALEEGLEIGGEQRIQVVVAVELASLSMPWVRSARLIGRSPGPGAARPRGGCRGRRRSGRCR